jgi:hypothetical protein
MPDGQPYHASTASIAGAAPFVPTQPGAAHDEHVDIDDLHRQGGADGSGRNHAMIWVVLVVAMFLAVPLLTECSMDGRLGRDAAAKPVPAPAVGPPAAQAPAAAPDTAVPTSPQQPSGTAVRAGAQPARPAADGARSMVTKCLENGRVIYTQTGQCGGSVSAVPIDADKNVVGPERATTDATGRAAPAPGTAPARTAP